MRYGISIPNFGDWADPRTMVGLARDAEAAGWDGFFLWDHIRFTATPVPVQDPWVLLSAIAAHTERLILGPMVTPLPRRRPWVVARQAVSLDHLSNGRVLLGIGIGEPVDLEYAAFGEDPDRKVRAEKLDEALAIIAGLWSGEEFSFTGVHYRLEPMRFAPRPVQQPRIPIIVAGGKKTSERDALKLSFDAVAGGAIGVDMGRNIFQSTSPVGMRREPALSGRT